MSFLEGLPLQVLSTKVCHGTDSKWWKDKEPREDESGGRKVFFSVVVYDKRCDLWVLQSIKSSY